MILTIHVPIWLMYLLGVVGGILGILILALMLVSTYFFLSFLISIWGRPWL